LLDDGPRFLDCLAFDAQYRTGDILGDIAFLAMDVEHIAGQQAGKRLLDWYAEFTGEHHPTSLAHHYIAYRAHVRQGRSAPPPAG
jgi:aminoglycoside phosphotransferase family enzyme